MSIEYRVFGPPGTGKTTWTSKNIANAAQKHGRDKILVASFTKAAASELVSRNLPIPRDMVGTLHAHCYRLLGRPEIAERHIKEWNKENSSYAVSDDMNTNVEEDSIEANWKTSGDEVFGLSQIYRARMLPEDQWPSMAVRAFYKRWTAWKRDNNLTDFTDMIEQGRQFKVAPGEPSVGFFDEVQDFTPLELSLVRQWASRMEYIVLAGDDDQCLYSFKGCTPDAFLDPPVPEEQKRVLGQSHRVPKKVQAIAERIISKVSRREKKEYLPRDEEGEVRRMTPKCNFNEFEYVLADAEQYLKQGKRVMFLTSCSYMLEPAKKVLRSEGLPFHNPYRRTRGDWNPLLGSSENRMSSRDRVLAFLRPDEETWDEAAHVWNAEEVLAWLGLVKAEVHASGVKGKLEGMKVKEITRELFEEELEKIFTPDALPHVLSLDLDWLERNLLKAKQSGAAFPIMVAKKFGGKKLKDEPRIIIGTIHSVKGGEAEVVYLFPDLSMSGYKGATGSVEGRDAIMRQFYVGVTRARESLILCSPATRTFIQM